MPRTPVSRKISWPEPKSIEPTPTTALQRQGASLSTRALQLQVLDPDSYARAVDLVKAVKQYSAGVTTLTDKSIRAAHAAHQEALKVRATLLQPAQQAEQHIKTEIERYDAEQRRLRQDEEAARQREQQRLEAEERARVAAEEARLRAEAEAQRKVEAETVAAAGDVALARRIAETPVEIAPVPMQPVFVPPPQTVVPKAQGVSISETYVARVTSVEKLVQALDVPCSQCGHRGGVSIATIKPDQTVLDRMAKAMREHFNVPGCESVPVRTVGVKI